MDEPKDDWPKEESAPRLGPEAFGIVPVDPDVIDEIDQRGIDDLEAGRVISNEAVMRWLSDLANGKRRPPPQVGE